MKVILLKDTDGKGQETLFQNAIVEELHKRQLSEEWKVVRMADMGIYYKGVAVKILPYDFVYTNLSVDDIGMIIDKSVKAGEPIENKLYSVKDKQFKIVLRNCGIINPEDIELYDDQGG